MGYTPHAGFFEYDYGFIWSLANLANLNFADDSNLVWRGTSALVVAYGWSWPDAAY
jgi:hypothetical protein